MDESLASLGWNFAICSKFSYVSSLFTGKLCLSVTLRNPSLGHTKWHSLRQALCVFWVGGWSGWNVTGSLPPHPPKIHRECVPGIDLIILLLSLWSQATPYIPCFGLCRCSLMWLGMNQTGNPSGGTIICLLQTGHGNISRLPAIWPVMLI